MAVHSQTMTGRVKMIVFLSFVSSLISIAAAQNGCAYTHDNTSPFYWKQQENLCTDAMCVERNLNCIYPAEEIHDAVIAHKLTTGENIMYEIDILERSFNATFPDDFFGSTRDYTCQGICERPVSRLERIFFDYPVKDKFGSPHTSRQLCFVVGPNIRYSPCSGKPCNIKGIMAGTEAYNCVPDVTTSLTVWLYCPDVTPQCVKTTLDIPISCSCARFQCPTKVVDPVGGPAGQGMSDLLGGMDLFGGLKGPALGPDPGLGGPMGVSGPVDVLSTGVDLGSMFNPKDTVVPGHVDAGFVDPTLGGLNARSGQIQDVGSLGHIEAAQIGPAHAGRAHKIVK